MLPIVVPSAVKAGVNWTRSLIPVTDLLYTTTAVSSSLPKEGLGFPWVTIKRITGIPQLPGVPLDHARLQFNVHGGRKSNGLPDWNKAEDPALMILAHVREFNGYSDSDFVIKEMAPFEGLQQLEDPETGDARFWFDVLCVVGSTT